MCNFKRKFLKCCVPWLRQEPMGAMTAVSFVNVLRLVLPGGYAFHKFSIQFTTFHNYSQLFTTLFSLVGEALKRRHLHFRNPYGQWWGQFAEMDKFSSFPHITQYTGTQVHHITFYLVNPAYPSMGGSPPRPKKKHTQKKINSQLFTTIHNFSHFFTIFHHFSPAFTIL